MNKTCLNQGRATFGDCVVSKEELVLVGLLRGCFILNIFDCV